MDKKEYEAAAKLLEVASEVFSNHGCNELDWDFWNGWTDEDKRRLLHNINKEPNFCDPIDSIYQVHDYMLMCYFALKLKQLSQ